MSHGPDGEQKYRLARLLTREHTDYDSLSIDTHRSKTAESRCLAGTSLRRGGDGAGREADGRAAAGKSPTARIPSSRLHRLVGMFIACRGAWRRQSIVAGGLLPAGRFDKLRSPGWFVATVPLVKQPARGQVCRRRGMRPLPSRHCRHVPSPSHGTIARSNRIRTEGRLRAVDGIGDICRRSLSVHNRTA